MQLIYRLLQMEYCRNNRHYFDAIARKVVSLSCVLALLFSSSCLAANGLHDELKRLDAAFIELASLFYQERAPFPSDALKRVRNIEDLRASVGKYSSMSDDMAGVRLLHANESLLMDNRGSGDAVLGFVELLLRNNDRNLAERIASAVREDGDRSLVAGVNFIFAKYHADRDGWERVDQLLKGMASELSPEDAAYAHLLNGVALQRLKKHREAIALFEKVSPSSRYYPEVQLNIAVGQIRQGWWTEAQITVNNLVKRAVAAKETTNRLHLILGYALLRQELYRNARDEFRKVTLDSRYANRALLGLGLAATNQGDYVGGVNAFSILKDKNATDLSADESHLLLPYVYSEVKQEVTATAGYNEAIHHYQRRITSLEALAKGEVTLSLERYDSSTGTLVVGDTGLPYGDAFPKAFIKNYELLRDLVKAAKGSRMADRLEGLLARYDDAFRRMTIALLEVRIGNLKSYLSQARYGLANYFDNSGRAQNDE